jgi:eukaryotic-like serine/threonine-protein kinase
MAPGDDRDLTQTRRAPDHAEASGPDGPDALTWGQFRLLGELGRGAFGRVYHAWDPTLARDIALKVVRLPDASRAAAALHEGRMLARVRHRNVVTVHGAQQIGDEVGVWMELVRGRHLSQIVREHGPMGAEEATLVGISICQALAAVHAASLIHRDVKANNVMRESGGRIVLMDFGAGLESGMPGADDLTGTPVYMAPEVIDGRPATPSSDLYSTGVLLFHIVTGAYPVDGRSVLELSLAHRRGQRKLLSDLRPDLPEGFVRAVERALSPSAASRPASAGAMLRELSIALPGSTSWDVRPPDLWAETTPRPDPVPVATPISASSSSLDARSTLARIGIGVVAGLAAIGLLGWLTTAAYNQSLGLDASFSSDQVPRDWFGFGVRALFAPALLVTLVFLAGRLVVTISRQILRLVRPLGRGAAALRARVATLAMRLGAGDVVAASQWLLVGQVIALTLVWLRFVDLIEAIASPGEVVPAKLGLLANESDEALFYRAAITLILLGMGLGWQAILSRPGAAIAVHRTTVIAGMAAIVFALLMLVVPYRLLYHNEMPRTEYEGARCYEVGARENQLLLYCPDLPPPRVRLADRALTRPTGIQESIFSKADLAP